MFFMENDNDIGSPVNVFMKAFLDEVETALTEQEYQSCPEKESHIKIEQGLTEKFFTYLSYYIPISNMPYPECGTMVA